MCRMFLTLDFANPNKAKKGTLNENNIIKIGVSIREMLLEIFGSGYVGLNPQLLHMKTSFSPE